jgi:hypothetical protein
MNKPNWKDAPSWAKYVAQDGSGAWYWYKKKPSMGNYGWLDITGDFMKCKPSNDNWKQTVEKRPQPIISINWDAVPENYKYFAFDENGSAYLYEGKPELKNGEWLVPGDEFFECEELPEFINFNHLWSRNENN